MQERVAQSMHKIILYARNRSHTAGLLHGKQDTRCADMYVTHKMVAHKSIIQDHLKSIESVRIKKM